MKYSEVSMSYSTEFAASFVATIVDGHADQAHEMLSATLSKDMSAADLANEFTALSEDMGGVTGIGEPMEVLDDWPGKAANELALVYVPLLGDVYSEAVSVTVAQTDGALRVSGVEWGRP